MEEKKLTDEKAMFNYIANDVLGSVKPLYLRKRIVIEIFDIIHRLQDENEELKYAREMASRESKQFVEYATKVNDEQKAEIERLENETTYLKMVADAFKGDYKNAKADGVRELLQELIEMEIKLDPLRSGIRYKALIGYAEENGVEVDL
jgi:hypothetical protein